MDDVEANKAVQFLISSLLHSIEEASLRLRAHKQVIAANAPELQVKVDEAEAILRASSLQKQYNELRIRAVQAVRDRDLNELAGLTGEVSGMSRL